MKFLKAFDKWLKGKCDSLPKQRQKQIVIGIFILYGLLSFITIGYFIYQF